MEKEKRFLSVSDVAGYMDISVPMAYKVIRRLNDELEAKGYLIIHGKISRAYFEEKVYGTSVA